MKNQLQGKDILIKCLHGEEFNPSAEMRRVTGVTWANDHRHHWYVASREGRQIACVGLLVRGGTGRFKTDVVLPEFRGQGLYRLLFDLRMMFAVNQCLDEGTTFSNRNSRSLYERAGFVAPGRENDAGVLYMVKRFDKQIKKW